MSLGVYRINKLEIEYEKISSFSLYDDEELVSYFDINENGITEVPVDLIEMALEDKSLNLSEDARESLKADIEFAKNKGQNYISYITF
jgi:hypothetical protein